MNSYNVEFHFTFCNLFGYFRMFVPYQVYLIVLHWIEICYGSLKIISYIVALMLSFSVCGRKYRLQIAVAELARKCIPH